jgi:hypothetical protein
MDLQEFEERDYRYNWQHGIFWEIVATRLERAATIILGEYNAAFEELGAALRIENGELALEHKQDRTLFPVYMLLMGYALENLIKGIIICEMWLHHDQDIANVTNFGDLKVPRKRGTGRVKIKEHLCRLFIAEGVHNELFTSQEKRTLLRELNDYVISAGRYPTSTKGPASSRNTGYTIHTPGISVGPEYGKPAAVHRLYEKAIAELIKLIKQMNAEGRGPKSPYPG